MRKSSGQSSMAGLAYHVLQVPQVRRPVRDLAEPLFHSKSSAVCNGDRSNTAVFLWFWRFRIARRAHRGLPPARTAKCCLYSVYRPPGDARTSIYCIRLKSYVPQTRSCLFRRNDALIPRCQVTQEATYPFILTMAKPDRIGTGRIGFLHLWKPYLPCCLQELPCPRIILGNIPWPPAETDVDTGSAGGQGMFSE